MRLKRATALLVLAGFVLLLAGPWIVGRRPVAASQRQARLIYGRRTSAYLGVLLVTFVSAGVTALFVIRNAREEYRSEAAANMRRLIEGAAEDRRKNHDGQIG